MPVDANNDLTTLFKNRAIDPTKFPSPEAAVMFEVMDHTGDTKYIWSRNNPDEVAIAKQTFESFTKPRDQGGKGYAAFHVTGTAGDKGEQMRVFDPTAERVIFVPPLAGG